MKELVTSGNALTRLMVEALAPTLKGATIGYFDSYAFFDDMYSNPVRPSSAVFFSCGRLTHV
jgi:hypothetical protein